MKGWNDVWIDEVDHKALSKAADELRELLKCPEIRKLEELTAKIQAGIDRDWEMKKLLHKLRQGEKR